MGSILLVPAVLSILQNPRTIDLSSGWGFLTYSKVQQYLAILVSWIMPPDSPYPHIHLVGGRDQVDQHVGLSAAVQSGRCRGLLESKVRRQ